MSITSLQALHPVLTVPHRHHPQWQNHQHQKGQQIDDEFLVFGQDTIWRSTIQTNIFVTTSGQATFKSLSENRIETLYTSIPKASKASARAIYNPSERRVYYFHNKLATAWDDAFNNLEQPGYSKDALIIDTRFQDEILPTEQQQKLKRTVKGAFFTYEYNDGAKVELPYIACPFIAPDVPPIDETVLGNSTSVTNSTGTLIVAGGTPDPKDVILAQAAVPEGTAPSFSIQYFCQFVPVPGLLSDVDEVCANMQS